MTISHAAMGAASAVLIAALGACTPSTDRSTPAPASPALVAVGEPGWPPPGAEASAFEANIAPSTKYPGDGASPCGERLDNIDAEAAVFLHCRNADFFAVFRVPRPGVGATLPAVLDALFAGPTPDEAAAGFTSAFGPSTDALPFYASLEGDLAVIDLDARFLVDGRFAGVDPFAELVATASGIAGVRRVSLLIEGEAACLVLDTCVPEP